MKSFHRPVLLKETIEYLSVKKGEQYIDATIGGGGHSLEICQRGGKVLGIDCDPEAIEAARRRLSTACLVPPHRRGSTSSSWQLVQGHFEHLKSIAQKEAFTQVSGILFDLGVSSHQLETADRGFAFSRSGPLDMRMDPSLQVTAADLVNGLTKKELEELFSKLGEERYSQRIAKAICQFRKRKPIKTTQELSEVISQVVPRQKINPATRCFQALRIAVNDELNNLRKALPQAQELLKPGGCLVVIAFHSGEDRIVKQFLKQKSEDGKMKILTKKPIRAEILEVKNNPRSRSAKLRAAEKNEKD